MLMLRTVIVSLMFATVSVTAGAQVDAFPTAQHESLYRELVGELRCLVCANQSLADSNSDLAKDLRARVAEMIRAGQTREQVIDYMVARYGEYVLYRPRFSAPNFFLWVAPFVAAGMGLAVIVLLTVTRRRAKKTAPYSAEDLQRARKLLEEKS